jgi:hypothetical protein
MDVEARLLAFDPERRAALALGVQLVGPGGDVEEIGFVALQVLERLHDEDRPAWAAAARLAHVYGDSYERTGPLERCPGCGATVLDLGGALDVRVCLREFLTGGLDVDGLRDAVAALIEGVDPVEASARVRRREARLTPTLADLRNRAVEVATDVYVAHTVASCCVLGAPPCDRLADDLAEHLRTDVLGPLDFERFFEAERADVWALPMPRAFDVPHGVEEPPETVGEAVHGAVLAFLFADAETWCQGQRP